MLDFTSVRHKNVSSIVERYLCGDDTAPEHPSFPGTGTMTAQEMRRAILAQGRWAFIRMPTDVAGGACEMHWYARRGLPRVQVVEMLAHELGHASWRMEDDPADEERRADSYGEVAATVFRLLRAR